MEEQFLGSYIPAFKTPESVYYDSKREVLYVANMNRIDEGETGFISKLATDGSVLELEWIKGLKEPRGMGVYNDLLFAVDSDRLLIIDIENSTIKPPTLIIVGDVVTLHKKLAWFGSAKTVGES